MLQSLDSYDRRNSYGPLASRMVRPPFRAGSPARLSYFWNPVHSFCVIVDCAAFPAGRSAAPSTGSTAEDLGARRWTPADEARPESRIHVDSSMNFSRSVFLNRT